MRRAAETQAAAIQNDAKFDAKKDIVVLLPVYTKDQVQGAIDIASKYSAKGYGNIAQLDIFSHGDKDGPFFHSAQSGNGEQWSQNDVRNLRITWERGANAYFFACYSAQFAQTFANAQNVTSWGNNRYAYFSSDPNKRVGPNSTGPVYLFESDGNANDSWWKYYTGNSEKYPMVPKNPNRRN